MLATALAVGDYPLQALSGPQISVDQVVDPARPFSFPFIVKNESWFFRMRDTNLNCGIDRVAWRGGGIAHLAIKDAKIAMIKPGDTALFTCSIELYSPPGTVYELTDGHLRLSVDYRTAGIARRSEDTDFTWLKEGKPPHWVKGAPATPRR